MAHTTISVSNGSEVKKVPLGFSWTTLFFGGIPALFRGDWPAGLVIVALSMFTGGIAAIIAAFIYNKIYAKSMFEKGYRIHTMPPGYTEAYLKADLGYVKFPYEV